MRTCGVLSAATLLIVICCGVALAQPQAGPPVQCGPAAGVITTAQQQQAVVAALQPRPLMSYTIERRRSVAYIVYENGLRFAQPTEEDHRQDYFDYGGHMGMATAPTQPDPDRLDNLTWADLPTSLFNNCIEYLTPTRSQSGRGLCHDFAAAALLEALVKHRLMDRGVPAQLAELDLSEEWMGYQAMRQHAENLGSAYLTDDGFCADCNLEMVEDLAWPLEAYWAYDPEQWPEATQGNPPMPKYPCGQTYADTGQCEWEYWGHREVGQKLPGSISDFRDHVSPAGPMLAVTATGVSYEGDDDLALQMAKEWIDQGRPIIVSLAWPTMRCATPAKTMYYVPDDYPFDVWRKLADPDQDVTDAELAVWQQFYGAGHYLLLVGYGKPGTTAEGIWLMKNSHGLTSGNDGIVPITDSLLRLSFPLVVTGMLSEQTRADLDRYADTLMR